MKQPYIVLIYLVFGLVLAVGGSLGSGSVLNDTSFSNYEVVGCIPHFVKNYQPKYEYLTHIAWASVGVNSDGTVINVHGLPVQLITSAHSQGVKVILIASNFDSESIDSVLAYHRNEVSNNLLLLVQNGNSDGIMIDFEGIRAINKYTGESNALLLVVEFQVAV